MTATSKTEFYADRAVDKIEKLLKIIYKVIWWIWPTVFWICFFCLWFLPKDMQKLGGDIGDRLLAKIPIPVQFLYVLAALPFWLWMVGGILAQTVKLVRKYFLYPLADFSETAMVMITKKERIVHHSGKNGGSYSYFLWIIHPVSQASIKVEVENAETFEKINEGDRVRIRHLLTPTNIVYLTIP